MKEIVDIITKESFPAKEDDNKLTAKLACLLKGEDKNLAYKKLMNLIAIKYVFSTGDDGNDKAYEFINRFAPQAGRNWRKKRQNLIEEKFIVLNTILSVKNGKEKNLSSDELHLVSGSHLRYKNHAMYIKDIKRNDTQNKSNNIKTLINKARKYVQDYQGNNIYYSDLLLNLCLDKHLRILEKYIQKRFLYLLNNSNQIDLDSMGVDDYQFYCQISKTPKLIDAIIKIINKEYDGDNTGCAVIILTINDPELNACYFSKRVNKLLLNGEYDSLVHDRESYNDFLQNDTFILAVNETLSSCIQSLVNNKEWDKFECSNFCHLVEIYGNKKNKETYRLLRIQRLLKKNDYSATKSFLDITSSYLKGTLESSLITLQTAKLQLDEIFSSHLNELTEQRQWNGNTQYFMEFFLPFGDKSLLYNIRIKWLEDFFNHPSKYSDLISLENRPFDEKYHYQNKDVPNDNVSLMNFYGKANLPYIKELIMKYIDDFNNKVSDEHVRLIRSFLNDNAFALDKNINLFCKKFEVYQKCKKINHCIHQSIWPDAIRSLSNFFQEINGQEALQLTSYDEQREQSILYNKSLLNKMLATFEDKFKEMLVSKSILEKVDSKDYKDKSKEFLVEKDKLYHMLQDSDLPLEIKESTMRLHMQSEELFSKVTNLVSNMHFNKLHLITFIDNDIKLFRKCLSENSKAFLLNKVKLIQEYLPQQDPLYPVLISFERLIMNEYHFANIKKRDLAKIREYRAKQRDYPQLAKVFAKKLIDSLNSNRSLVDYFCFQETHSTYQNVFLHYLKHDMHLALINSLNDKIMRLVNTSDMSDILGQQKNWIYHGILYQWLMRLPAAEKSILQANVSKIMVLSLVNAKNAFKSLIEKFDSSLLNQESNNLFLDNSIVYQPKPETLKNEQQLINTALFIRSFGDEFQKKVLDDLLAQVAKRQRRCMMKGLSGSFFEHCLDYADKLIMVAGSPIQRSECEHLIETWNRYRTVSLRQVRELAIEDALPQYIKEFDKSIYQYFIKQHNLSDNFSALMSSKFEQWHLSEEMIEPNQLLKKHPIKEFHQILLEESKKRSHSFFYTKPSERDANKLFVAFCLHLQAHQLVSIWNERKKSNQELLNKFTPEDISEPLSVLVNNMSKKFDIGRGEFNRSIHYAISKNDEYFASWSIISEEAKKFSQMTETAKRVASK